MAAQYGMHFGWRFNSDDQRLTDGSLKTPAGYTILQGSVVVPDPANPGYLKVATDASGEVGQVGLLQQDDVIWARSDFAPAYLDTHDFGNCKPNHRSVMVSGAGMRFWAENLPSETRRGRVFEGIQMWDPTSITAVGNLVGWDGSQFVKVTDRTEAIGVVKAFETTNRVVVTLIK